MRRFLLVTTALLCAVPAIAGPLAPCIRAASSASGSFLVITDLEFSHPLPASPERITLDVVPAETFDVDTIHKVDSPNKYWISASPNGWSVQLEKGDRFMFGCPVPIISNDGEFLILLRTLEPDDWAMRVYRRGQGHKGTLVKDIAFKDIWPENKWQEWRDAARTDSTPEWFAGGSFAFSSDSHTLIHKTRWGNVVEIRLSDGTVRRSGS
jgi:hypothetical protein